MQHSPYHIDGWLTNYECLTDLEGVNDVIALARLTQGYTGDGLTTDQWGFGRMKTIEEVGLSDHKMAQYLPNEKWTNVISESEWVDLKAHILKKLAPQ